MRKLEQAVLVEGKYDAARLTNLVDATILTTDGSRVFRDKELQNMLKRIAAAQGLIILTDSDDAGFRIRHFVTGLVGVIGIGRERVRLAALEALKAPKIDPIEPFKPNVVFDDFEKCDFRVCRVLKCEAVKKSQKLLRFELDDGSGTTRQILSGIAMHYKPEELAGKTVAAIVNLPPRKMMGLESCGMLLSAVRMVNGKEELHLVMLDNSIPVGSVLC